MSVIGNQKKLCISGCHSKYGTCDTMSKDFAKAVERALKGIEHRQPAPQIVERGSEAGIEMLQFLSPLQRLQKLQLKAGDPRISLG